MDVRDSLLLIELDKGAEGLGPLFEEPRRRLQEDAAFRAAWARYQGVKALAWEAAPDLDERLIRQGLQASRRQEVERRLARATGSEDAARELLLKPEPVRGQGGLPTWAAFLLLVGALGLGWLAFGPSPAPKDPGAPFASPGPRPAEGGDLAFEFPAQASGASDSTLGAPPSDEEPVPQDPAERKARQLLRQHLSASEPTPKPSATARPAAASGPRPAPTKPLPKATASPLPTPAPTPQPTDVPTLQESSPSPPLASFANLATPFPPTATPVRQNPGALQGLEGSASEFSLSLSSGRFPSQAVLALPEGGAVDLRLFDMRGRLVRRYVEGEVAAGRWRLDLDGTDGQGQALPAGSYYLRVITRWASKVEALEQP